MGNFLDSSGLSRVWNKISDTYLSKGGGAMTGTPYINMPASAASIADSQPFGITYGRVQCYGTMYLASDTDGSQDEYTIITSGYSVSNSTKANGLAVGYNSLTWKNSAILTSSNWSSYVGTSSAYVGYASYADTVDGYHASSFSLSGHNHDGRYVRAYDTSNDNIDSDWGQSFKTFDPIPSGNPPEQSPNISLLSIGENFARRKMFAFIWDNDNIYYRRRTSSFSSWVKLLHTGNSYVSNGTGVINGNTITQVSNADTLDGYHAGHFGYMATYGQSDCNEVGPWLAAYRFDSTVYNAFYGASYGNMLCVGGGDGMDTEFQIGAPYYTQELYFRNGTWYSDSGTIRSASWNRIWHENNDGAGSGLDADLLDGKHAKDVFNMYAGGFTPGSGAYWGKIAEYEESFTGTIDVSTTFLVTPYYGNMGIGNILVLSFRGENTSLPIIEANWILKTFSPNITITYRIVSNTLYVRIYIYLDGWRGTNIKILNSHGWAGSDTSHWTLYSAVYAGNGVATFDSIPSNENVIGIGLTSLNVSSLTASGAVTAGSASDKRLKEDVKELELSRARDIILHSRPITFKWNSLASSLYSSYSGNDLGLIAQELESTLPEAVGTIFGKYKRLDYTKLITPMIKIQQDHDRRIEELENKVAELTEKLKHTN